MGPGSTSEKEQEFLRALSDAEFCMGEIQRECALVEGKPEIKAVRCPVLEKVCSERAVRASSSYDTLRKCVEC